MGPTTVLQGDEARGGILDSAQLDPQSAVADPSTTYDEVPSDDEDVDQEVAAGDGVCGTTEPYPDEPAFCGCDQAGKRITTERACLDPNDDFGDNRIGGSSGSSGSGSSSGPAGGRGGLMALKRDRLCVWDATTMGSFKCMRSTLEPGQERVVGGGGSSSGRAGPVDEICREVGDAMPDEPAWCGCDKTGKIITDQAACTDPHERFDMNGKGGAAPAAAAAAGSSQEQEAPSRDKLCKYDGALLKFKEFPCRPTGFGARRR